MEVKTFRKTQQVFIETEVNGARVYLNYDFSGVAPSQVNVSASYNGNGVSSSANRAYKLDGTYTPVPENMVYPFNSSFNTAIAAHISVIAANPENPDFTVPSVPTAPTV